MKILLMFFNERCYTYELIGGYFEPMLMDGRRSRPVSETAALCRELAASRPDAAVGLLRFEERYAPFTEEAANLLKKASLLTFAPSARQAMRLTINDAEDEQRAASLMQKYPAVSGSGSGSGSGGGSGSGSGSGSGDGGLGYGIDLI